MKTSPGGELLSAYYLKHIARNLKIILKGKALGKSETELEEYVDLYTEELIGRRDLLVKVMTADTLQDAVDSLSGSEFYKDIATALKMYNDNPQINIFDVYIDKAYHTQLVNTYTELDTTSIPMTESISVKLRPIISHVEGTRLELYKRYETAINSIIKSCDDLPNNEIIFKLHPQQNSNNQFLKDVIKEKDASVKIIQSTSIKKLLIDCDLHINLAPDNFDISSVVLEAMILKRPTLNIQLQQD